MTMTIPAPSGFMNDEREAFAREIAEAIEDAIMLHGSGRWDDFERFVSGQLPDCDECGAEDEGDGRRWGPRTNPQDARSVLLEWCRWAVNRLEAGGLVRFGR